MSFFPSICFSTTPGYRPGPEANRVIERILDSGRLMAMIVSHRFTEPGVTFFTPADLSQQLAYMHHPAGKRINPHMHNPVSRQVMLTQETLILKRGKLRVDFFDDNHDYLESRILGAGDVLLLIRGGHGFEVLEELEMFVVNQGPYTGDQDKANIDATFPEELRLPPL